MSTQDSGLVLGLPLTDATQMINSGQGHAWHHIFRTIWTEPLPGSEAKPQTIWTLCLSHHKLDGWGRGPASKHTANTDQVCSDITGKFPWPRLSLVTGHRVKARRQNRNTYERRHKLSVMTHEGLRSHHKTNGISNWRKKELTKSTTDMEITVINPSTTQ